MTGGAAPYRFYLIFHQPHGGQQRGMLEGLVVVRIASNLSGESEVVDDVVSAQNGDSRRRRVKLSGANQTVTR